MSLGTAIQTLKATADPTRLRLLALLAHGEASVGELQEILEQSQPRVSRHLRLLDEAGLVVKFRDGHWIYYRLTLSPANLAFIDEALSLTGTDDEILRSDRAALDRVKNNRERDVFSGRAPDVHGIPARPSLESLTDALEECIGERRFGEVLDIGCGGGALLRLLGRRARRAVGIDSSRRLRLLARSRLHREGLANCTVRDGGAVNLPFADDSFDLVVLDEVLDGSDAVLEILREARRVLRASGEMLIVDRIRPVVRQLSAPNGSSPLIDNQLSATLSELGYRVAHRIWFPGKVMEYALFAAVPDKAQKRTGTYD